MDKNIFYDRACIKDNPLSRISAKKMEKKMFCSLCESKCLYLSVVNVILVRMKFTLS